MLSARELTVRTLGEGPNKYLLQRIDVGQTA